MNLDALILAAGMGERLRPLTSGTPKPLIPVMSFPLIDYAVQKVLTFRPRRIFINGYNLKEQIEAYCRNRSRLLGVELIFLPEKDLLGSGGPIKKVMNEFGSEDLIVHNADLIHEIHVSHVLSNIPESNGLACLVMTPHNIDKTRPVYVSNQKISGFGSPGVAHPGVPMTFTGIYRVSKAILEFMPRLQSFGIVDCFRTAMGSGRTIDVSVIDAKTRWFDLGTATSFLAAQTELLGNEELLRNVGWYELENRSNQHSRLRLDAGQSITQGDLKFVGPCLLCSSEIKGSGTIGPNVVISNSKIELKGHHIWNSMISEVDGPFVPAPDRSHSLIMVADGVLAA